MILDRYFQLNMASSSSYSPVFTRYSTGRDDSAPSSNQIKRQQYQNVTARAISRSSVDDDDEVDSLDGQPPSSAVHEVNGSYSHYIINIH
jgi:hypothetical protein